MCNKGIYLWIVDGGFDNAKTVAVAVIPPSWDSLVWKLRVYDPYPAWTIASHFSLLIVMASVSKYFCIRPERHDSS
jgi:hypothetical protein